MQLAKINPPVYKSLTTPKANSTRHAADPVMTIWKFFDTRRGIMTVFHRSGENIGGLNFLEVVKSSVRFIRTDEKHAGHVVWLVTIDGRTNRMILNLPGLVLPEDFTGDIF